MFRTGDLKQPNDPGEITNEVTPIKVGDTLFLCTAHQRLFALDAATGKEKWHFDPQLNADPSFQHVTCRGVSYHEAKADNAPADVVADCPRRIILPVNDGRLFAVNADNGKLCETFANKGILNLQTNMPVTTPGMYEPTSPPIITDKTIVIAGAVTDNFSTREPSGVIRGFDVNTGKLLWAFDPGAKDPNAIPSDEHHFTLNSPNSWAPAAYDAKLDLVYLPMGVTTPDIWGGNRTPEQERYASSIVALNATTGKLARAIRPSITICGIWTCLPSRRWLILRSTAKPYRSSMPQRKPATSSCWIVVTASWWSRRLKTGSAGRCQR